MLSLEKTKIRYFILYATFDGNSHHMALRDERCLFFFYNEEFSQDFNFICLIQNLCKIILRTDPAYDFSRFQFYRLLY